MTTRPDFEVGDIVTPNYKGVQYGWPKDYEAEVLESTMRYGNKWLTIKWVTEDERLPFDGSTISNDRAYTVRDDQMKKVRVLTKKSLDSAIKSIMTRA